MSHNKSVGLMLKDNEIRVWGMCLCGNSLETYRLLSDEEQKVSGMVKTNNFLDLLAFSVQINDKGMFLCNQDGVYRQVPVGLPSQNL